MEAAVQLLKKGKSAGVDNIPAELVKAASGGGGGGGGGGFFFASEDFEKNVRQFIPRCAFFYKVQISSRKLIPLLRLGSVHSGSAS